VHGRLDAVLLARRLGKWDAINLLLESLGDRSPEVRSSALTGVRRWIASRNASFEQPTRAHLERLESALSGHPLILDRPTARELEALARYWA
jgi:hypothetical protein